MSKISVASRIAPCWRLGLTAGKIGFLLLTWSFIVQFGLPSNEPETSALPNETLVWRLMMSHDVNVIALRGTLEPELQDVLEDTEMDKHDEMSRMWSLLDGSGNGTILLEGQCDESTPFVTNMWFAYAILLVLELYILNEFKLRDQMVFIALLTIVHSIGIVAVVANRAPDQTINLWVVNN